MAYIAKPPTHHLAFSYPPLPLRPPYLFSGILKLSTGKVVKPILRGRCIQGEIIERLEIHNIHVTVRPEKLLQPGREAIETSLQVSDFNEIDQRIRTLKAKLQSIGDGELSISAYDTAWVALVKDIHGLNAPQFPSTLEWIINNQLPDGSWGDQYYFCAYDRLSCTLACVVALKTWNIHAEAYEKGISFLRQNLHKLEDEDPEHQLSGFEVTFTTLLKMASKLGLEILQDSTVLQDLYDKREQKLKRIPMEILYSVPTTLLHSLEGLPDLDWRKLLKLQHPNGSFLCSTSSTAYALMHTKDEKCFEYLRNVVERFNGAPHTYPVDLFERLWIADRLDRLGMSRYYKAEIMKFLDHVYRFWTPDGISWSRQTIELDIDDTSMAFRMLRLYGYDVKADAFQHFEREGQFFCFVGQNSQGITEMLSLYRASQLLFPGEEILEEGKNFASNFLKEKQTLGQVADRWLITKDLVGEVKYYLDVPWYANLPRIETRYYIDQYGGDADVWIAKVLYRMYNVSNNQYLELAKLDYNHCQKLHQQEWTDIQRWYEAFNLRDFDFSKDDLLKSYFLAMSSTFEPELATERLAWAQTASMIEVVSNYFKGISIKERKDFVNSFTDSVNHTNDRGYRSGGSRNALVKVILETLWGISFMVQDVYAKEVYHNLKHAWTTWLQNLRTKEDNHLVAMNEAELLVCTINLCAGRFASVEVIPQTEYIHLANLTNDICNCLRIVQNHKVERNTDCLEEMVSIPLIEQYMQELLQCVVQSSNGVDMEMKRTFLTVAKTYYYTAYSKPTTIELHIQKVLFEGVV